VIIFVAQFAGGEWFVNTRWFKYDRDWFVQTYTQISPGHIWTTLYVHLTIELRDYNWCKNVLNFSDVEGREISLNNNDLISRILSYIAYFPR